jgi:hypothetical protein
MPSVDLSDAYLKLARAREHIAEAEARINAFLQTEICTLALQPDPQTGTTVLALQSVQQPGKKIDVVIGDAISNLRSTLDYIAVALIEPITGKGNNITFPFADDEKGFAGEVRKAKAFGPCAQAIIDHFINDVQAYKGGKGETLWVLNKLRNIDKHRFLVTTLNISAVQASFIITNRNVVFKNVGLGVTAGHNGMLMIFPNVRPGDQIQFTDKPRLALHILFNEPSCAVNIPVGPFLYGVARDMESVLNALSVVLKTIS